MTIKTIIEAPDERLKVVSTPVDIVDDEIRAIMDDMLETMYNAPGIGLAAVQVGVPKRIIVMDVGFKKEDVKNPMFFVNPEIKWTSEEWTVCEEGCLSVPNQFADIERPESCIVNYLDYQGQQKEVKFDDILARCIQHEMDHLEGILFIDRLSIIKKNIISRKLVKEKKRQERVVA